METQVRPPETLVKPLPSLRRHLSGAVARVARLYAAHPSPRPDVVTAGWEQLEDLIDVAFRHGNADEIRMAIERWERHATSVLQPETP